ncbi:MAG: flippase [Thermodesulfobacteriota bacterium]
MTAQRGLGNFASIVAGNFLNKAVSIVVLSYLTWHLGPSGFGRYSFVVAYMTFFGIFTDMGVNTVTVRAISRGAVDRSEAFGAAIVLRLVLTVAALAASFAALRLSGYGRDVLVTALAAAPALFVSFRGLFFRNVFEIPFLADLRMDRPALVNFANELLVLAVVVVMVTRGAGLVELLVAINIAYVPGFAVMAISAVRRMRPRFALKAGPCWRLLKESAPLGLSGLLEGVFIITPVLVLSRLATPASLGLFTLPLRLVSSLWIIPVAVMVTMLPAMSRDAGRDRAALRRRLTAGLGFMVPAGFVLALAASLFSDEIIILLSGEAFARSSTVLSIMAWGTFLYFVNSVFFYTFAAAGRELFGLLPWCAATAASFILGLIFIPRFAHLGAGWAFTISMAAGLAVNLALIGRVFGATLHGVFSGGSKASGGGPRLALRATKEEK